MKKLLVLLLVLPVLAIAQIPQPFPNTRIHDYANLLSPLQVFNLNQKVGIIEHTFTGVQMAIVIIDKLPSDMPIEEYALQIGRQWHVGNHDSGIVFVLALQDHKIRLEIARPLEGVIPDITASHITATVGGFFHHQQYFEGFQSLLDQIVQQLKSVPPAGEVQPTVHAKDSSLGLWIGWIIFISGLSYAVWYIFIPMYLHRRSRKEKEEDAAIDNGVSPEKYEHLNIPEADQRYFERLRKTNSNGFYVPTGVGKTVKKEEHEQYVHQTRSVDGPSPIFVAPSFDTSSSSSSSDNSSSGSDFSSYGSDNSSSSDSGFSGGGSTSDF